MMLIPKSLVSLSRTNPRLFLFLCFVSWKLLLLVAALASPGPGYDTSTQLVYSSLNHALRADRASDGSNNNVANVAGRSYNLVRWDAIYFTQVANRGYLFEQEWAFSWGFTRLVGFLADYIRPFVRPPRAEIYAGVLIAHISHLTAVMTLHALTLRIFKPQDGSTNASSGRSEQARAFALIAASIHVLAPGGLFLSAPYSESLFAALQFAGYYLYAVASAFLRLEPSGAVGELALVASGLFIGLATSTRGNGLFSGTIFAYEAVISLKMLTDGHTLRALKRGIASGTGGLLVAAGAAGPQAIAYTEYCRDLKTQEAFRPWCLKMLPSIYTFVQSYYWGNGLFKYWTISNIPLFILAAPILFSMLYSAMWVANLSNNSNSRPKAADRKLKSADDVPIERQLDAPILQALVIPQTLLFVVITSSSHVQIVNRLSSGYPVWIWCISELFLKGARARERGGDEEKRSRMILQGFVVYAIVQGGLYASFLPPA